MKVIESVLRFRWLVVIIGITAIFTAAAGTVFLKMESDTRIFFGSNNPQLKTLDAFEETYNKNVNNIFVIEPKDRNVFTRETLSAIEELTRDSWLIPYSSRVDSITNFQHMQADGDDLIVEDLVKNPMMLTDKEIKRIKDIALSEPALVKRLVSPAGHVSGVSILFLKPGNSPQEDVEIVSHVREMADKFTGRHPELNLYISGSVMWDNAFAEAGEGDMMTLIPIMFLVMTLIIFVSLRSVSGTIVTVFVIAASAATAMGITGWLGMMINPVSANAPTIILTLAIADSIHILSTMLYQMRNGKSKYDAVIESLRLNLQPVFLTSITTSIGFLTMNFSDAPPFHDLGNIVAMGVMAAFVYSVFFLPALILILPVRVHRKVDGHAHFMDGFGDFVVKRRKPLFYGMAGIMLLLAAGIPRIELEDTFSKYIDQRYKMRRDSDFIDKNLSGWNQLEYSIGSGEENGIVRPGYLKDLERLEDWFSKQPKVRHVNSITGIMKRLNRSMHADDPAYYKIPDERQLAAQYLLLYEMSLPFGLDLNSQINVDKSASRFTVTFEDLSTRELRDIEKKGNGWIKQNLPDDMRAKATGEAILWAHISERNINTMLGATLFALVLISGILMIVFRSFRIGIISLIPNLAPAIMAFGLWGLMVGHVGLSVAIITAMTFGIVVDDTVHFLSKYLRARREQGVSPYEAVRYSFRTVGPALLATSVILAAGFMVLTFSGFRINSDMGLLTAITIMLALMADFLFLPPLLMKMDAKKSEKESVIAAESEMFKQNLIE
ncbi:MAG: RND family transporter [Nitrospinota bacterium]